MELRQLRSLVALVESGFSVSRAAERLNLVQPAVSQHLRQLEDELGAHLILRHGRRLTGLTEAGAQVLGHARSMLAGAASIAAVGKDQGADDGGVLRIATTHTQARYVLPGILRSFRARHPGVELEIYQGTPQELVERLRRDLADLAICTESVARQADLETAPCYRWNRCLIAPHGHVVLTACPITLELLCAHPLITYVLGFTGRGRFGDAFAREGLRPRVVLSAADTDVVKTYVREGLGIGIIADMAYEADVDSDLGQRDLTHLFPAEVTRIAHVRGRYLRRFQREFIALFQHRSAQIVQACRQQGGAGPQVAPAIR